jgi:two-component system, sensor histidine kinase and response regulator
MDNTDKILVIDDETGIRQGCCRVLRPQGFVVEAAENFKAGLGRIQEETFDLVLLDVMLPDGKGIDLLEPIRKRDPDTVSIIITGYATVELAVDAIKKGAYNFISKPFTADLLLMTVNQGLEKRHLSREAKRLQAVERETVELTRARDEAERLNEFKSSFLLTAAHELRSPVSGAQSLVRTLLRGLAGELTQQQSELLSRVEIRLDFLLEMINDLLNLSSSKSIETDRPLEKVQVQAVIRRVMESFADEAKNQQVFINYEASGKSITAMATEDGLDTVLRNLIGNAIKYSPQGGTVEVGVQKEPGYVKISVSDIGIGIPEEDIPLIWDEFFRAKNAHLAGITGTGLGLSIVRQLIDRFGGHVDVVSSLGKGTTFTVSLRTK